MYVTARLLTTQYISLYNNTILYNATNLLNSEINTITQLLC